MKKLDLSAPVAVDTILLHSLNNVGKTHLLGSMLATEKAVGKCVYVAIAGEPYTSALSHDLTGVDFYRVEKASEIADLVKEIGMVHAIALDSVQRLAELVASDITGDKYVIGAKEDHGRDWSKLKGETFRKLMQLQLTCNLFVAACPSWLHENNITKVLRVVPDVPGVNEKLVGRFNFAGYLEAVPVSPTVTKRQIGFQTRLDVVTRCNARRPMTKPIPIPDAPADAWGPIKAALEGAIAGK